MPFQPVNRRSIPDEVFDQLFGELVSGALAPGESLPSERRLAEVLGVSRPAIREALQRLAHAGLVEVRQGDATTVRDIRRTGGLDLLPRLLFPGEEIDLTVARSVLEARLHIGPKIAELAASRGGPAFTTRLQDAVQALENGTNPIIRQQCALFFWDIVTDAADSVTFRLMFNSLRSAYEPALDVLAHVMSVEVDRTEAYAALTAAIAERDPARARRCGEDLLRPATEALIDVIDQLEVSDEPA
ncbi:FadR/GntR family transcriptional regulator [Streptomyces sp. NPDC087908]|uniref:FadR/GntR family transcriptional regulator n=1 Tax=Streptomyces sp. NPDC087908 TaxID=3365820 RepID=UPI0038216A10